MQFLQIHLNGWTATPRLPMVISGNARCMPVPSYSSLLGLIGCCLGRPVSSQEVNIGCRYMYSDSFDDLETRHRLKFKNGRLKVHPKGTDAYKREVHLKPVLTLWLSRLDWQTYFEDPCGTPSLGQSQDILQITGIELVDAELVQEGVIKGCMLPVDNIESGIEFAGRFVQIADSFIENDSIGSGRSATASRIFVCVPYSNDRSIQNRSIYKLSDEICIYMHDWQ